MIPRYVLSVRAVGFLVRFHETAVADHIGGKNGDEATFHPYSPFRDRLAKHKGKIYLVKAGSNFALWHKA